MTDDREILASENRYLRKANRRWRIVTFVAIACAFLVMVPFTIAIDHSVAFFLKRDLDAMIRHSEEQEKEMRLMIENLEKQFQELERARKKSE